MNFDFSDFHPGHNKAVVNSGSSYHVVCLDCGVSAEVEGIAAKINIEDAFKTKADIVAGTPERKAQGQLSKGRPSYKGGK